MARPQRTTVQVPLVGGLDQKTAPDLVQPGSFLEVENCWRDRTGEFRKRYGSSVLTKSTTIPSSSIPSPGGPVFLGKRGSALLYNDVGAASSQCAFDAYNPSMTAWTALGTPNTTVGYEDTVLPSLLSGTRSANDQSIPDCAVSNGLLLAAWEETNGSYIRANVMDATTGSDVIGGFAFGGALVRPRCVATASYLVMFYIDTGTAALKAWVVPTTGGTISASFYTIASDVSAGDSFLDAQLRPGGTTLLVSYRNNAGSITCREVNPATGGTVATATFGAAANADMALAWADDSTSSGSYYLVTAGSTGGVVIRTLSTAFAVTATTTVDGTATANVRNVCGFILGASGADKAVYWEISAATVTNSLVNGWKVVSAATTAFTAVRGACLASKPFRRASTYYAVLVYPSTVQPVFAVCVLGNGSPSTSGSATVIGWMWPGEAGGRTARASALASVSYISGSGSSIGPTVVLAVPRAIAIDGASGTALQVRNTHVMRLAFAPVDLGPPVEFADMSVWPGGAVRVVDGSSYVSLYHPPLLPESVSLAGAGGGSMTLLGTYGFVAVYKFVDGAGRVHRSPPSVPVFVTLTGAQASATVSVATLRIDVRQFASFNVSIEVYRTIANGTVYYKDNEFSNDPSTDATGYTSTSADSTIRNNEILYTTGGVLPSFAPTAFVALVEYKARLVGIRAEDRKTCWYSKELKSGQAPGFHPKFSLVFDSFDGDLTALGVLDDKIIFFKRSTIYALAGDGPDDNGVGGFDNPQQITNSQGTINPRSVVQTPAGLMFEGARGLWQLDRGGQLTFVGAPVQPFFTGGGRDITAAVLVPDYAQVRFFTSGGRTLVWDYQMQQWYTFTGQPAGAAVAIGSTIYWAHPTTGVVSYEVVGSYGDNGTGYAQRIVPPWLALAGLAGFERVKALQLLGENVGTHTLKVTTYLNYNDAAPAFTAKTIAGASGWPEPEFRFDVQRCTAAKVAIEESAANTGAGFRLSAASLEVAIKKGLRRLPSAVRGT